MGNSICSTCTNSEETFEKNYVSERVKSPVIINNNYLTINNIKNSNTTGNKNQREVQIMEYNDGSSYMGEIIDQKKHGLGIMQSQKYFYEGEFINDNYHGYGYIENTKRVAYSGEFVNGMKEGVGLQFSKEDSYSYEGEWKNNSKHGIGREKLPDNSEYIGEFSLSKKHGKGIYKMSTGRTYYGDFQNGKIEGYGLLEVENGEYYKGNWEDNSYNGFGELMKKNTMFKGFFKQDKKYGYGIKFAAPEDAAGLIIVGNWINNSSEGVALGINSTTLNVEKIFKFAENKFKSCLSDSELVKSKLISNKDCINLINFFLEYKDK